MTLLEAQFRVYQMNAMRCHAELTSGAYKYKESPQSEEEKLLDKVHEMKIHINNMYEAGQLMQPEDLNDTARST